MCSMFSISEQNHDIRKVKLKLIPRGVQNKTKNTRLELRSIPFIKF